MALTELALITLRNGINIHDLDFLETLMEYQDAQDDWLGSNVDASIETSSSVSNFFIDETDSSSLLITKTWNSAEVHSKWVNSSHNQETMQKLLQNVAPDYHSIIMLQLDAAGRQSQLGQDFLAQQNFSFCLMEVNLENKQTLQNLYLKIEGEMLERFDSTQRIWAGWETQERSQMDGLVLLWNKNDLHEERVYELTKLSRAFSHRCFKNVV